MTYKYPDAVLMIFCKTPIAGQVKTRLMATLTAEQAVRVHIELAQRTLQLATKSNLCPVELWCTPSPDHPFFITSARAYQISLQKQQGDNLGERMSNAFCLALNRYSRALIVGCDCPSLVEQDLEEAITALNQNRCCVLAPAEDGGYVLIGLNWSQPGLFNNIAWGTGQVFEQTIARIKEHNFRFLELKQQWDLDEPEDLVRYRRFVQG